MTPEKEKETIDWLIRITFVMIVITFFLILYEKCNAQTRTGYYLFIYKNHKITELKTEDLQVVKSEIEKQFKYLNCDFLCGLNTAPYVHYLAYNKEIYIEKKKIAKNGRYIRLKGDDLKPYKNQKNESEKK